MEVMNKEELVSLREEILATVTPLAIDEATNQSDKFQLLIRLIRAGSASVEVYRKAFECAKLIEDNSEKFNSLLELMDEIELDISDENKINEFDSEDSTDLA